MDDQIRWALYILLVAYICGLTRGQDNTCPHPCTCLNTPQLISVDCSGQNLTSLFPQLSHLDDSQSHLNHPEHCQSHPLVKLNFSRNRVSYLLRHFFLPVRSRLQVLEILDNSQIMEIAPSALDSFSGSLRILRLGPLQDSIDDLGAIFSSLTSLQELTISSSASLQKHHQVWSKPLFQPGSQPQLQVLRLHHFGLVAIVATVLEQLPLRVLDLSHNHLHVIPDGVVHLAGLSLTRLYVAHNQVAHLTAEFLSSGCQLRVLDLSFNRLVAVDENALFRCADLDIVNFSYNSRLEVLPPDIFRGLQDLTVDLDHTGIGSLDFVQSRQIRTLRVEGSKLMCSCQLQLLKQLHFGHRLRGTCQSLIKPGSDQRELGGQVIMVHDISHLDLCCADDRGGSVQSCDPGQCSSCITDLTPTVTVLDLGTPQHDTLPEARTAFLPPLIFISETRTPPSSQVTLTPPSGESDHNARRNEMPFIISPSTRSDLKASSLVSPLTVMKSDRGFSHPGDSLELRSSEVIDGADRIGEFAILQPSPGCSSSTSSVLMRGPDLQEATQLTDSVQPSSTSPFLKEKESSIEKNVSKEVNRLASPDSNIPSLLTDNSALPPETSKTPAREKVTDILPESPVQGFQPEQPSITLQSENRHQSSQTSFTSEVAEPPPESEERQHSLLTTCMPQDVGHSSVQKPESQESDQPLSQPLFPSQEYNEEPLLSSYIETPDLTSSSQVGSPLDSAESTRVSDMDKEDLLAASNSVSQYSTTGEVSSVPELRRDEKSHSNNSHIVPALTRDMTSSDVESYVLEPVVEIPSPRKSIYLSRPTNVASPKRRRMMFRFGAVVERVQKRKQEKASDLRSRKRKKSKRQKSTRQKSKREKSTRQKSKRQKSTRQNCQNQPESETEGLVHQSLQKNSGLLSRVVLVAACMLHFCLTYLAFLAPDVKRPF